MTHLTRPTLAGFVREHFPHTAHLDAVEDGLALDCPRCGGVSALTVRAWPGVGAAALCSGESCDQDFAAALAIPASQ